MSEFSGQNSVEKETETRVGDRGGSGRLGGGIDR